MAASFEEYVENYRKNHREYFADPMSAWIDPFRIYGPLYYVGDRKVCIHLIDTGDGLVLIDAGFTHTVPMLLRSISLLGFRPEDVKTILLTHGHFDHMGAAEWFRRLYGTKIGLSKTDAELISTRDDFALTTLSSEVMPMFRAPESYDLLFDDETVFNMGDLSIRLVRTPGHTPGVMTFFFDVTDHGVAKRCGLLGGVGLEAMKPYFLDHFDLPHTIPGECIEKLEELKREHVDIHLGNHPWDNDILTKREEEIEFGGDRYDDPAEWPRFLSEFQEKIRSIQEVPVQAP